MRFSNDPQDPDYTGYDFWLTKLNQFNGNYIDAEMVKGVHFLNLVPAAVWAVRES